MSKVTKKGRGTRNRHMDLSSTEPIEAQIDDMPEGVTATKAAGASLGKIWVSKWTDTIRDTEKQRSGQNENRQDYNFEVDFRADISTNHVLTDSNALGSHKYYIVNLFDPTGENRVLRGILEERPPTSN